MGFLRQTEKKMLDRRSRSQVQQAFQLLGTHFTRGQWLASSNRYRQSLVENLSDDIYRNRIKHNDLAQYVAASAPLHCADGWSYLGRALECHACGDSDAARHLAYYAELRGAMSLLASEGIGVFNDRHFVVWTTQSCGMVNWRPIGTHEIAWLALDDWAADKSSTVLLAETVRPGGRSLKDWLDNFCSGSQWQHVARDWLITWGLDLKRLNEDRFARNEASYRPTRLNQARVPDTLQLSQFIRHLWRLYEPKQSSPFDTLDKFLLRLSYEKAYTITTNKDPHAPTNRDDFEQMVMSAVKRMGYPTDEELDWHKFLTRKDPRTKQNHVIIDTAKQQAMPTDPYHHVQVMSRAALLLRVATGVSALILNKSGLSQKDIGFWWKQLGQDRGLWTNPPNSLQDLWADVETALNEMENWEKINTKSPLKTWRDDQSRNILTCGGCERIALWGLGL